MLDDLQRLVLNDGKKSIFTSESLMLAGIKAMVVTEQHTAVHMLELHDTKQTAEETIKTFVARVRGITAVCELFQTCSGCSAKVCFQEKPDFNVIIAGLRDQEPKEKCSAAQFCSSAVQTKRPSSRALAGSATSGPPAPTRSQRRIRQRRG